MHFIELKNKKIMNKIISILLVSYLFLAASCSKDNNTYYDMYLSIEVVDNQGNDLLGSSSPLIHQNETKMTIGGKDYYLNSPDNSNYTFRHIQNNTSSFLKIGCWYADRKDAKIVIDWGGDVEKDVIVFSYDTPLDGLDSPSHDFRYPYSLTINGKSLTFNEETERFTYVKDIENI